MRTMPLWATLVFTTMTAAPVWSQSQYDQWAGWDSGRADRLVTHSGRDDGGAVRTIAAQPLRGSVNDVLHARVQAARVSQLQATAAVSRYPAQPVVRHRDPSIAVNVDYRREHPSEATYIHKRYTPVPRPIYIYPHPYAPRPALIYYRPACSPPPPVVYRPYPYCPPQSGFHFSFTYRN